MKRIVFPLIVIVLTSIISCSRESAIPENDFYQESELLSELAVYNQSVLSSRPNTRVPGWAKFCAVAGADFTGAYTGAKAGGEVGLYIGTVVGHPAEGAVIGGVVMGAICGVGGSALAYNKLYGCAAADPGALYNSLSSSIQDYYTDICEYIIDDNQNDNQNDNSNNPLFHEGEFITGIESIQLPQAAIAMGAAHNAMLRDLQNRGAFPRTRADVGSIVINNGNQALVQTISQEDEVRDYCISFFEDRITDNPVIDESLPGKVIQIYSELLESSSVNDEDVVDYINHYYSIVSQSTELTDSEKNNIYIGLAVSLFSFNYWKEYGVLE